VKGPSIDWAALSPLLAVFGGAIVVLMLGLMRSRAVREGLVPLLALATLGAFAGLSVWQWDARVDLIAGAMRIDTFAMYLNCLLALAGIVTVLLAWRSLAPRESAHGEFYGLLLTSIGGMSVLVGAQNLVTMFLGFELLSIPLYVLCATEMRRARSLESGLKYLIIGSVGSAALVYGMALVYGATGSTDFGGIARAIAEQDLAGDTLLLGGIALVVVGLAFKASVAPFHQWTPDVYEGAPTVVTTFMAVATKVAAFGVLLRMFDVALIDAQQAWGPGLATLAIITIVVGNVGALGQSSLKRLLAWSSVAQAGYLMGGVVVGTQLGVAATLLYLGVYLVMNVAAFAVIVARERESRFGDHIDSVAGIGRTRPWLAWSLTIAMLSLAGIPATGGFIAKFFVIDAAVSGGYTWLAIAIVLGSAVSLAYYLRVVAAIWMRSSPEAAPATTVGDGGRPVPVGQQPLLAGGSPELDEPVADRRTHVEVGVVAVLAAVATLLAGILPGPLFEAVREAADSFSALFGG
jgi:NADH-quinone oxidoreductase subunit N